jgi:hypothetical protein
MRRSRRSARISKTASSVSASVRICE